MTTIVIENNIKLLRTKSRDLKRVKKYYDAQRIDGMIEAYEHTLKLLTK